MRNTSASVRHFSPGRGSDRLWPTTDLATFPTAFHPVTKHRSPLFDEISIRGNRAEETLSPIRPSFGTACSGATHLNFIASYESFNNERENCFAGSQETSKYEQYKEEKCLEENLKRGNF